MERQNRPPALQLPTNPPQYLSALSYHRTPSAHGMPSWASSRRRNLRRTCAPVNSPAGIMFLALLLITATFTYLLVRSGNNNAISSPLSRLPDTPNRRSANIPSNPQEPILPPPGNDTLITPPPPTKQIQDNSRIANETLNFQKIFAINLPSRLDRKDHLTLMSSYANLSITIVPGVKSVAENALPAPRTPGDLRPEEYAVWRAHANVWRKVLEDGLTTALVLEDDNDWDVNLKEQVPRILDALEEIRTPRPRLEGEGVVRGGQELEGWDILYLGSCMETAMTSDVRGRKVVVPIPSDRENVAAHNYNWVEEILRRHGQSDPPTRLLQRTAFAQCTHSYAITAHGARKLLYYTSLNLESRLDMAIAQLVRSGSVTGFTVIPPVMVQWKHTERASKDTDVGYDTWRVQNWGFAHSLRYKLRKDNQVGWQSYWGAQAGGDSEE